LMAVKARGQGFYYGACGFTPAKAGLITLA
jgi:hypothetical protein